MPQVFWTKAQRELLIFLFALMLNMIWVNVANASEPGDLDTSFNGTGIVTTSVSSTNDGGFGVAIQSDGKIVVAGTSSNSADFAVVRYKPDGSLDTNFNGTGIVTTSVGSGTEVGFSVALQTDNKIVVAGTGDNSGTGMDFVVIRYNEDGSLDTGFSSTGVVTTHIGSSFDIGRSVTIQSNGKIVVAGDTEVGFGPESNFAIVRYNQNGSLDTSFKGTGIVTTTVSNNDSGQAVLVQSDGKIVVAGSSSSQFITLRYTTTGELDPDFNGTGIVTTPVGSSSRGTSAAIQADGKIVVVGSTGIGTNTDFAVVRYTSTGNLDTTFNGTGIITTDISAGFDVARAVVIQPDNKIIVVGVSNLINTLTTSTGDFTVVRYNSDGGLDTTFGDNGIITTTISLNRDEANAAAIQAEGEIVVVGFDNASENPADKINFVVTRYIGKFETYLPIILKE